MLLESLSAQSLVEPPGWQRGAPSSTLFIHPLIPPLRFLFIHQNFPGQFRHLAASLQREGHHCQAIGSPQASGLGDVPLKRYAIQGVPEPEGLHPWARDLQIKCLRAEAAARQADRLRREGFQPDLILGHPGWGELLAIKDVFPDVPVLHYLEFLYPLQGGDVGFDPEYSDNRGWHSSATLRLRRVPQLLALHDLDRAIAPTHWQASTAPQCFAERISVIHDGIDTERIRPDPRAWIRLQGGDLTLHHGDELVSFVARNLEPYRGFHRFMRMLPLLQALRPRCRVVVVGGDEVSYGKAPDDVRTWRQRLLAELGDRIDHSRLHFVGRIPHRVLHNLFQVSACHVYLTYPFVLSWSLLEAMSCATVVVASDTEPVREVIRDGDTGLLVDFFDGEAMARRIASVLAEPERYRPLGIAARQAVVRGFDLHSVCLPQQRSLIRRMTCKDGVIAGALDPQGLS
jgi:glycosyltransferase involved in cell wall biosynthesis